MTFICLSSCKNNLKNDLNINTDVDTNKLSSNDGLVETKQIIFSLPAAHEVALILIENKGTDYNEEILNPVDNFENYNTSKSMALNLGIYSADLSYASLFEQNQAVISYMLTSEKLAVELGILDAFSKATLMKLENNLNDKDAIIRIISETFMDTDAYLQENNKEEIAAMIIIGGWIEGMYIAAQLSGGDSKKNSKLVSSIIEQQASLSLMVAFLETYENDTQIQELLLDIRILNDLFDNFNIEVTVDGNLSIPQKEYLLLCEELEKIRNKFTNDV